MLISYDVLHCDFQFCVNGQDTFILSNWGALVHCSSLLVTRCIVGWPKLACCGLFCNCDEGVTQMLN